MAQREGRSQTYTADKQVPGMYPGGEPAAGRYAPYPQPHREYSYTQDAYVPSDIAGSHPNGGGGGGEGSTARRASFNGEKDGPLKKTRASKACETCRLKRTRCDGASPCSACIDIGMGRTCLYRTKARPNRPPRKSVLAALSASLDRSSGPSTGNGSFNRDTGFGDQTALPAHNSGEESSSSNWATDPGQFIRSIEERLESFAASRGVAISLSLPPTSFLTPLLTSPLPALPKTQAHLENALETFLSTNLPDAFYMSTQSCRDLLARYMANPEDLAPDELALMYGCLSLGRLRVLGQGYGTVRFIPMQESGEEEVGYYRRAMEILRNWGRASPTSLTACCLLRNFAYSMCGPNEVRDVLRHMAWQCKEMRINRTEGAAAWQDDERVGKLFWLSFYNEGWFATLNGTPPLFPTGEYDPEAIPSYGGRATADIDRVIEPFPFLISLSELEHDLLTMVHSTRGGDIPGLLEFERRLQDWHKPFVQEKDRAGEGVAVYTFGNIRFFWLRIMLRAPLLDHPLLGSSSLTVLARAASQILIIYSSISTTKRFPTTWAETRRIATAIQAEFVCYLEGEIERDEMEAMIGLALDLLWKLADGCLTARSALEGVQKMVGLFGLTPRLPPEEIAGPSAGASRPVGTPSTQALSASALEASPEARLAAGRSGQVNGSGPDNQRSDTLSRILDTSNETGPHLWPDEWFLGDFTAMQEQNSGDGGLPQTAPIEVPSQAVSLPRNAQ